MIQMENCREGVLNNMRVRTHETDEQGNTLTEFLDIQWTPESREMTVATPAKVRAELRHTFEQYGDELRELTQQ